MSDFRELFIEEAITGAVRRLLAGRVNEILRDMRISVPVVEFGNYEGRDVTCPEISLAACERTEKERLILLDAYSLTIGFTLPETAESELRCYAYAAAVCKALQEDMTLDGVADRVVITGKKYMPPKAAHCGGSWGLVITLRVTVGNEQGGMRNERKQ